MLWADVRRVTTINRAGDGLAEVRGGEALAARRGPTLRSQWLGKQLRELREEAGLTLRDLAAYVQRDASSVSRMEAGMHPARVPDVLAYVTYCGESDEDTRAALVKLAQDAWQTGLWDRYTEGALKSLMDLAWLEARAVEMRDFQALVLPGLLQTSAYAEAVMRESDHGTPQTDIDRWVEVRLERQKILAGSKPPIVKTVLDESVLHREVGSRQILRDQVKRLIELAECDNITILVLPWSSGAHASPEGCFEVLLMEEPYSPVGYAETPGGAFFLERNDVDRLISRHERLSVAAHNQADSLVLMRRTCEELGGV
jgi:hypothetical protein